MKKRFLAAVLCAVMALALLPTAALAMDDCGPMETVDEIPTGETMNSNNGTVVTNRGAIENNNVDAIVTYNYGTIENNNGTVTHNYGLVHSNTRNSIVNNYVGGTVDTNSGVVNNYGGTVTWNDGTVNTYRSVTFTGTGVENLTVTDLTDANSAKWILDTSGRATFSASSGCYFASAPLASNGTLTNNNGVYTLTGVTGNTTITVNVQGQALSNSTLYYNATDSKLHIGSIGGDVVPATATDIGSDGITPVYSGSGNTLTLSGVSFTTTVLNALVLPADMTLTLAEGTANTISVGTAASTVGFNQTNNSSKVIYSAGALTINGSGTLNAESYTIFNQPDTNGSCIEAAGSCTINAKVNIVGGNATNFYGVKAGSITVNDPANVDVNCSAPEDNRYGLYADSITVNSGTVDISFEEDSRHTQPCYGIHAGNNIMILGGSVSAITGNGGHSYGIHSSGSMTISGGIVTAAVCSTRGASYGIAVLGALNITGGHITASETHAGSAPAVAAIYGVPLTVGSTAKPLTITGATEASIGSGATITGDKLTQSGTAPVVIYSTHTVTYDRNGGSGTMASGTATYGVAFTLPACTFTAPANKQFKEWAIGSVGGTKVDVGGAHTFTGDTTVYAIWEDHTPVALTGLTLSTDAPTVGTPITATVTPAGATASYKWYQNNIATTTNGMKIIGAESASYTPRLIDVGKYLYCVATGTGSYSGTASAVTTGTVAAAPSAAIDNVTVSGTVGTAITPVDTTIALTNEKFNALAADADVSDWFTNLPAGLSAKIKTTLAANATEATVTFTGTPTATSADAMTVKISAASLVGNADLDVTTNANARWAITAPGIIETPDFSPAAGTYTSAQSVTLTCATSGAVIRYTTDGSVPTASSPEYAGAITVNATKTIKAKAFKNGMTESGVAEARYVINIPGTVSAPTFAPPAGTYASAQSVTLLCETAGATIHYTTDGTEPDAGSMAYTTPVSVTATTIIKAKAFKTGMTESGVAEARYTIEIPPKPVPHIDTPVSNEPVVNTPPTQYPLLSGQNSTWLVGNVEGAKFAIDADYSKYLNTTLDGKAVGRDKITTEQERTIVILKPEYLATLEAGEHTLRVNFTDGYAVAKFTIDDTVYSATVDIPQTGDNASLAGYVMLAAALSCGVMLLRRRRG